MTSNGPFFIQLMQPPPLVVQMGLQNTSGGNVSFQQLYKGLLDVDPPGGGYSIDQDGWIPRFLGSTQHLYLDSPENVAGDVSEFLDLSTLADVDITGLADGDLLYWNAGDSKWEVRSFADFGVGTQTEGFVLTIDSGVPTWLAAAAGLVVTGSPSDDDEIRWNTDHAEWFTPTGGITSFQGASQGYETYDNTGGNVTSGSWSYTIANSTPQYAQLSAEVSFNAATDVSIIISKNGTPIASQSCAALAGNGWTNVTSSFVTCASGDVFTLTTTTGTRQQFAIQVW